MKLASPVQHRRLNLDICGSTNCIWSFRRNGNVSVLFAGEAQRLVCTRLRRVVRPGVYLRLLTGRMAVRNRGSRVVVSGAEALVAGAAKLLGRSALYGMKRS